MHHRGSISLFSKLLHEVHKSYFLAILAENACVCLQKLSIFQSLHYSLHPQVLRTHVMVRVGGGWDTLEHYLDKHDPCRCAAFGEFIS